MFTKRATSIIPSGGKIYLHPAATQSVDYEGELAIIIGKAGRFQLPIANRCFYLFDRICRLLNQEGRCTQIRLGGYDFERRMLHWRPKFILYDHLIPWNIKISARDRQKLHKQFYVGKSFDTFCPIGPFVVHCESYSSIFPDHRTNKDGAIEASAVDWDNLMLETRVNGEVRQRQSTLDVIFDIPTLIENCAAGITWVGSSALSRRTLSFAE